MPETMICLAASTPGVVWAVVGSALAVGVLCLGLSVFFAFADKAASDALVTAAKRAGTTTTHRLENPAQEQAAAIDFGGLAQLATALDKLNRSGRFLIAALAFWAIAAAAAGATALAS